MAHKAFMANWGPGIGVAAVGLVALTCQIFAATSDATRLAVIIPPWQDGGFARAAGFDMPIIDLRWHGHLVIIDASAAPTAAHDFAAQGLFVLDAARIATCLGLSLNVKGFV